ncbi:MAG: long-chain fatty acid--CoA ligase [Candidatus Bathyarchaeia archaeon]
MSKVWLKSWPSGVPLSINYPEIPVFELLRNSARRYPNRVAIAFYGRRIRYKELDGLTDRFATALYGLGVRKGDRVALLLPNVPQFVIAYYGALKAGGVVTTVSPLREGGEMGYELVHSGAETLIALDQLYPQVEKILDETRVRSVIVASAIEYLPPLRRLLAPLRGFKEKDYPGAYRFRDLIHKHGPNPPEVEIEPREDLAVLQYTGGTTSRPKGVMLTHYNLVANAIQTYHWAKGWGYSEKPQERVLPLILCAIPFFHAYGMTVAMNEGILSGATLILIPKPDPESLLRAIDEYKPSEFPGIPPMFMDLAEHPDSRDHDFSSLHHCISGAASLPMEVVERFEEVARAGLIEGYGLTEAGPVTHCNPVDKGRGKLGSVGIPYPDTEAKVVDVDLGEVELPPGEVGELVVRGPQVMRGYWNDPEGTERVLRGGWLHTGDLARMDGDGYFYIVGRKMDLIARSGQMIGPKEVEEAIASHPAVEEVAVVGVPDPYRCATDVKAFVVLREGYGGDVSGREIREFCEERLASHKVPTHVEFRDSLPKTPLGKVYRRALREEDSSK